jgi:ATP-binding cassette subfamily B protein/subfamily B ATP-binding cassette protein MsbA
MNKIQPLIDVLRGEKKTHILSLATNLFLQVFASLCEGMTFAFTFAALTILSGEASPIEKFNHIAQILHLPITLTERAGFANFMLFFLFAIAMQILKSLSQYFAAVNFAAFVNELQMRIVRKFRKQLFQCSFSFINHCKLGELVSAAKLPFDSLPIFVNAAATFLQSTLIVLVLLNVLFFISFQFTLVVLSLISAGLLLQRTLLRKIKGHSFTLSEHLTEYLKVFAQTVSGIRLITTFHRFAFIDRQLEQSASAAVQANFGLSRRSQSMQQLNEVIAMCMIGICALVGYFFLHNSGTMGMSLLITYLTVLLRTAHRVPQTMYSVGTMAHAWGEVTQLMKILSDDGKEYISDGSLQISPLQQAIRFNQINHAYDGKQFVLHDITFDIPKGKTIALVGRSGSGKSTIADLLVGLYKPTTGQVLIDGVPLHDIQIQSWRDQLGVVSQETFIFNDTVYNNICFGLESVAFSEIERVAQDSGCSEFIKQLPNGYDTMLGERGYRLSGGEKQRLALARALLKTPHVLILDEATSSLDTRTERFIMDALEAHRNQATILIIAHRLSTISNSDEILVIDQGKIVERGSHEGLLRQEGAYAQMWHAQTRERQEILA